MDALSVLERWVEPLTGPLGDFLKETQELATTHQNSVSTFRTLVADLTDVEAADAFVGDAATSMLGLSEEYIAAEFTLSGTAGALAGPIAEGAEACAVAVASIGAGVATAAEEAAEAGPLIEVTEVVTVAAAAEGEMNPVADVAEVSLIAITAGWIIGILVTLCAALFAAWWLWRHSMDDIANKPRPSLPETPTPPAPPQASHLTEEQQEMVQRLAQEYGVDPEDIARLLEYDPTLTEADLRKILDRYKNKKTQFPNVPAGTLLLALAMNLPDSLLQYLTHLNDGKTNMYLKGQPGDPIVDVLTALLGELTQESRELLSQLQSKIARRPKGQSIEDAVNASGLVKWKDLPAAVQEMLSGKSKQPYELLYGNAVESLVFQKLDADYPDVKRYYEEQHDLQIEADFSGLYPDVQMKEGDKTIIIDVTSQKNMPSKSKYSFDNVDTNIAVGYGAP
jgi:hypothetical protein